MEDFESGTIGDGVNCVSLGNGGLVQSVGSLNIIKPGESWPNRLSHGMIYICAGDPADEETARVEVPVTQLHPVRDAGS